MTVWEEVGNCGPIRSVTTYLGHRYFIGEVFGRQDIDIPDLKAFSFGDHRVRRLRWAVVDRRRSSRSLDSFSPSRNWLMGSSYSVTYLARDAGSCTLLSCSVSTPRKSRRGLAPSTCVYVITSIGLQSVRLPIHELTNGANSLYPDSSHRMRGTTAILLNSIFKSWLSKRLGLLYPST